MKTAASPQLTRPGSAARRGFTLIELLTVIAIIGILAAILIPVVGKVRASARITKNVSNLRALSSPFFLYAQDNKGFLPRARESGRAWPKQLLPYIQDLSVLVRPGAEDGDGLLSPTNPPGHNNTLDAAGNPIYWSYVINGGPFASGYPFVNAATTGDPLVQANAVQRPSLTMMLADAPRNVWWINAPISATNPDLTAALANIRFEDNKTTVLFFDGHVTRPTAADFVAGNFRYKL